VLALVTSIFHLSDKTSAFYKKFYLYLFNFAMENLEVVKMTSEKNKLLYCINGYKFAFQKFLNDNVQIMFMIK